MAGIFETLDLGPAERMVAQYVPGLLQAGGNKLSIFRQLQSVAPDITRIQSGSLVDYVRSVFKSNEYVNSLAPNDIVDTSRFPPAESNLSRNYLVKVQVKTLDQTTGVYYDRWVSVLTDNYTTREEFLNQWGDKITAWVLGTSPEFAGEEEILAEFGSLQPVRNPSLP